MTGKSSLSFEINDEALPAKVRHAVDLLEEHLCPEERDAAAPSYRLGWYHRTEARECSREDIDHFRRFVEEMSERALRRAHRTQALFPTPGGSPMNGGEGSFNVLRARQLCESFCASLGDGL